MPTSQRLAPDHPAPQLRSDTGVASPWSRLGIDLFPGNNGTDRSNRSALRLLRETTEGNHAPPNRTGNSAEVAVPVLLPQQYRACQRRKLLSCTHIQVDRARRVYGTRSTFLLLPTAETGAPSTQESNVYPLTLGLALQTTSMPPCLPPLGPNCLCRCSN